MQQGGRGMEGEAEREWGVGQADVDGTLAGGKRRGLEFERLGGDGWDCLDIVVGVAMRLRAENKTLFLRLEYIYAHTKLK